MAKTVAVVVFFVLFAAAAVTAVTDYCSICSDHTLCLYTGEGPKCSPRVRGAVDAAAQTDIVDTFNALRQRVADGLETLGAPGPQPPAANMRLMVWNPELARIAQRWADQCDFKVDSCRKTSELQSVGQARYKSSSTSRSGVADWAGTVNTWYNHVKDFNKSHISPYQWGQAGLYTQAVWAGTHQVGCGYTVYKESGDPRWTHHLYVCNFGPGGNLMGGTMYNEGAACSKCPAGTSCSDSRYPSLCA